VLDKARALRLKLAGVLPFLNEKQRRVVAAAEAKSYGRGGVQTLAGVTGMCRQTIYPEVLANRHPKTSSL